MCVCQWLLPVQTVCTAHPRDMQMFPDLERQDMLERQVSVALDGGDSEDDIMKAFDSELHRIVQFYEKKVRV